MAKLADRIRGTVTSLLGPDEQLQAVEKVVGLKGTLVVPALAAVTNAWYAGVTNRRFVLIPLNKFSKPQVDQVISIPMSDLEVTGKAVTAKFPNAAGPVELHFHGGAKFATGLDKYAFLSAIRRQQ
jgi:hypothetical protein